MKSYKQLDTLSKLNSVNLIFPLALCAEKSTVFLIHIYEMHEKSEWIKFSHWKKDWVAS